MPKLDNQVDLGSADPTGLQIDRATNTVAISKIFEGGSPKTGTAPTKLDKVFGEPQAKRPCSIFIQPKQPRPTRLPQTTAPPYRLLLELRTGP